MKKSFWIFRRRLWVVFEQNSATNIQLHSSWEELVSKSHSVVLRIIWIDWSAVLRSLSFSCKETQLFSKNNDFRDGKFALRYSTDTREVFTATALRTKATETLFSLPNEGFHVWLLFALRRRGAEKSFKRIKKLQRQKSKRFSCLPASRFPMRGSESLSIKLKFLG